MTKSRKGILSAIMCLVMLLIGVCALTACGSKDLTVTFSVEGKTQQVEVVDGKVAEMPADPTKEFYSFRGWYTTSTFDDGTEFTKDTEVKENLTVYAYFAPIQSSISVNGETAVEIKLEELEAKTTEYTADAESKNLTFDGWYVDSAYTTKYVSGANADNLYARYMATVTFNNGYENLKVVPVGIGSTMKAPDKEYSDFIPYYMDNEDLSYVDENGKVIDFGTWSITTNATVRVVWKSSYLSYKKIDGTANDYAVVGFNYGGDTNGEAYKNIQRFPAISFLSENVTINGVKGCNVVAVDFNQSALNTVSPASCESCVYAEFAEGIQYINAFVQCAKLEKVELPSTLKIVEKSFWNMRNLKGLDLPDGLEVVIDSFWGGYIEGMVGYHRNTSAFAFDVVIPASVKTIVTAPSNFKFAEGSAFYYEDGELFENRTIAGVTYKTLICTYQTKVDSETLTVKEGTEAVAIGAFHDISAKFISLPSTFKAISYASNENNETYDYTFYTGSMLTDMARVQAPDDSAVSASYSVYTNLGNDSFSYIFVNANAMPEGVSEYAFTNGKTPYTELEDGTGMAVEKIAFIGAVAKRKAVTVHIIGEDTRDASTKRTYSITGKKSGGTLTIDEVLEAIGINDGSYSYTVTEFGKIFEFGTLTRNVYLEINYTRNISGVTYTKDDAAKTITVTGFDKDTAFDLGGVYRIYIAFDNDELKDYKILIANNAFKNNNYISEVYVGNKVASIGESAFEGASNLSKFIVADGGLEEVKKNAFLNAGCIVNGDTITVNEAIKKNGILMVLPLANMKNIEPYAFKTKAIYEFTLSNAETPVEDDSGMSVDPRPLDSTAKVGEYFFVMDSYDSYYGIVKYMKNTDKQTMKDNNGADMEVVIYDVQYVATAGGYNNGSGHMGIGQSNRNYGCQFGSFSPVFAAKAYYVWRYEVMEGSVYYLGNGFNYISFGIFTKIHTNAFTDMEETRYAVYNNISFDIWMDEAKIKNQDSSLFEEGWFEGKANSENTFMQNLEDHEDEYL